MPGSLRLNLMESLRPSFKWIHHGKLETGVVSCDEKPRDAQHEILAPYTELYCSTQALLVARASPRDGIKNAALRA